MPEERVVDRPPAGVFDAMASAPAARRFTAMLGARGTRRRRQWIAVFAVAVILAGGGTAAGLTLRHLDHQYGPLQGGSFGGPYGQRGFTFSKSGSLQLADAPNATGQLIASLDNLGAHSVEITSIEPDQIATKIEWSVYRMAAGGSVEGVRTPWRIFPAVVPAHGTIRVLITIHHPNNCDQYPKYHGVSEARYLPTHWVNWESLLHSHRSLIEIWNDNPDDGIGIC